MNITTTIVHNHKGTAQVVAKGQGKQRTIAYDHEVTHERNHGNAAGTLALVLIKGDRARKIASETAKVTHFNGGKVKFTLG